jgi:hypothetical protein
MYQFAQEGLRLHPRTPRLVAALDVAATHGVTAAQALAAAARKAETGEAPAAEDAPKKSWWKRAVSRITGKGPNVEDAIAAGAASLDTKLATIADELDRRADVSDRRTLLHILRVAHAAADHLDGKVKAMVAALRQSSSVSGLPSDQELSALLRRVLG